MDFEKVLGLRPRAGNMKLGNVDDDLTTPKEMAQDFQESPSTIELWGRTQLKPDQREVL